MKTTSLLVVQVLAMLVMFWFANGCSFLTPNQQYRVDASLYNGASLGLGAARAKGSISDSKWKAIQGVMAESKEHLKEAYIWLGENPNLANVPGYKLPALDPAGAAIGILLNYAGSIDFVPIDPPATAAPTTQPGN